MARMDITQASSSDMTNTLDTYAVGALNVDSVGNQDETEWINTNWPIYWGYFNENPELKSALIMKSVWNVGKGYLTTNSKDKIILEHISGWGKDTFRDILFNMDLIKRVGGDSFAEIIRKDGVLINIKPLDPGSMKIIVNRAGQIIRYEQMNKIGDKGVVVNKFKPNEILHFSNNRLADQIHGISDVVALENTLKADAESFADNQKLMHRQARPFIMFKLKTDDPATIAAFISKMDTAMNKGENVYIPDDENIVTYEVVNVPVQPAIFDWRNEIRNKFYRAIGLPQIVPGGGGQGTESESKVIYLAFEQIVENDQKYIEDQIWSQLSIKINLNPPASLSGELQQDQAKDTGQMGMNATEMQPGVGE